MLAAIGLIAAGFALGVALTTILAGYVFGLLHQEAVRILDGHAGVSALAYRSSPGRDGFGDRGA